MLLVLVAFWTLFLASLATKDSRARLRGKRGSDLALDLVGLGVQGVLVPAVQLVVLPAVLVHVAPRAAGVVSLGPVSAFALNFVGVDALYYYNHRALHAKRLWPWHRVHHTVTDMDVLGTSRNAVLTPALIVYVWVNGLALFLLAEKEWFLLSMSVTAALDLWRHSRVFVAPGSWLHRALRGWLITPHEHAWHHGKTEINRNFGANLAIWDRLHGTYASFDATPIALGVGGNDGFWRRALVPWTTS